MRSILHTRTQPERHPSDMPSLAEPRPVTEFTVDSLRVLVFEDRAQLGRAAALNVARAIAARLASADVVNVVFAAAPSQNEFLAGLVAGPASTGRGSSASTWTNTSGIDADHPASFRRYLQEHLFRLVGLPDDRLRLIPGEQADRPLRTCLDYEDVLRAEPTDIVCAGIGENGHLAFNDPPVADFLDPVLVKVVRLDAACRDPAAQRRLLRADRGRPDARLHPDRPRPPGRPRRLGAVVPGPRKAEAVLATLRGPISEACPATALRRHKGALLYLDRDSAQLVL